ncbi:MAG: enoyl-CoA hydratase/isomerase family protein [Pacificimonas sp.]|nr:enoyl-CoA hydratase/isomerase family protein [Pacificimonas sp.]
MSGHDVTKGDWQRFSFARSGRRLDCFIDTGKPMNPVDEVMHEELSRIFDALQRDEGSDLIVLSAKGKAFCAGGDFDWMGEMIAEPERFRHMAWDAKRIVGSLLDMEKPVICRLNGAAAGLGATIALLCDIIIADERAKIGDPHVKVGLVAGDGGALIWPQLIGYAKAKELLLTGDMLTAAEAVPLGLINHAVPTADLDAKVDEIAGKILANPNWAVRWTKTVTNIPLRALSAQTMDAAGGWESVSNGLDERRKIIEAMLGEE